MDTKLKVAVIGAGVIGLSTALHLTKRFPDDLEVTIMADRFTPDTASDRSSASIKPHDFYEGPDRLSSQQDAYCAKLERWYLETMKWFHEIHNSEDNSDVQLSLMTHYHLQHEHTPDPSWKDLVFGFRHVLSDSTEFSLFNFPSKCKLAWCYNAYTVNPTFYLQWLQKQLQSRCAVSIKKAKIDSLEEVSKDFDVVINCTGAWASHLLEKESMQPARGQAIFVKAPWIKHSIHYDAGPKLTYIIARSDSVALGGTLERGNWSETIEEETTKDIMKRCIEIEPSLAKAEVIKVCVGLRPLRSHIRLDKSVGSNGSVIIHCYGHGGQGITLSWGCAKDIGDIVQDIIVQP